MINYDEEFCTPSEWECFLDQLNAEDLEKEYLVLWDYTDQDIEFYGRVGFPFYYEAVIDGCDCVVVSQSDEMIWLDEEFVESYWDPDEDEWIDVR